MFEQSDARRLAERVWWAVIDDFENGEDADSKKLSE
jgi:hypothetical protein